MWCHVYQGIPLGQNGVFASAAFEDALERNNQGLTLSASGTHFQNGVAEPAIQTVTWKARVMMIHAALHWPDEFDENLWPFALSYAAWVYNHTPRLDSHLSPNEIFCGVRNNCKHLRRAKVWGAPTYVLDPKLQDGHKIPKWRPRARRGQFLGFSPQHSTTVGLIRNLQAGNVSPQFHIVLDEPFTTVSADWRNFYLSVARSSFDLG